MLQACSQAKDHSGVIMSEFKKDDFGIQLKSPASWVITDKSMSPGTLWLVISTKEFVISKGMEWPFVNIVKNGSKIPNING
jgi:hypothetical protein